MGLKKSIKDNVKEKLDKIFRTQTILQRTDRIEKAILQSMPPATGKLREFQLEIYKLLIFLKKICDENNLLFWIQGGTLLGAKRHNGFIPWDDDLDCGMPREDLNRLKNILKHNNSYEIIDCYHFLPEKKFACKMPKLVDRKNHLIFVDIFPYDYITTDNEKLYWSEFLENKEKLTTELLELNIRNVDCPLVDENNLNKVENIINSYIPAKVVREDAKYIIWGIENLHPKFCRLYPIDKILPNEYLLFEDDIYPAPADFNFYLKRQFGDIWKIPKDVGELKHFIYNINSKEKIHTLKKKSIIGYTAGAFDLFHIGHLNLLKKAKENCDFLIVGVTTDELVEQTKGKKTFIPMNERIDILKCCRYVDEVVIQDDLDKIKAWEKYKYDILFSGNDWQGSSRWIEYERKLNEVGVTVQYFEYTDTTSSTKIQQVINENIHRGKY